jgi:hypothetical protein
MLLFSCCSSEAKWRVVVRKMPTIESRLANGALAGRLVGSADRGVKRTTGRV